MPKESNYEYDYEWTGQEEKAKGIVLAEKNPWNKPNWGNPAKPVATTTGTSSFAAQPDRFGMDELKRRHQWSTPAWATMKGKPQQQSQSEEAIVKDPIPKPMLKQTAAGAAAGIQGATSAANGNGKWSAKTVAAAQAEIAAMEQQIAKAKQKKENEATLAAAAALAQEEERLKHTVEETKLEKARRLAKEREDARWRATLAERNERDKTKREQARLEALASQHGTAPVAALSDATWGQAHTQQQQRYDERVQQEALKRQHHQEVDQQQTSFAAPSPQAELDVPDYHLPSNDENAEYYEEIVEEEYGDEVVEDETTGESSYPDELQRQIDALRLELETM